MHEGYGIPIGSSSSHGAPQEVSPVSFTLHLSSFTRKQLYRRLQQAYGRGDLGYPLKAGQLEYDRRYSKMHGLSVTGRPWL